MMRWLMARTKTTKEGHIPDLFNPPFYAMTHLLLHVTHVATDNSSVATCVGTPAGVGVGAADGSGVGASDSAGAGQHEGATSCRRCCGILCEKCKKHDADSTKYLQKLSEAVNELKKKRSVKGNVSKNLRYAYTPQAKRRKESFAKTMKNLKRKMFGEISRIVMEEMMKYKKLNIYRRPSVAEKAEV
ncbi:hypothetical protein EJD97_001228 [Solanum chilense]|uniref:Uncharacterized protein n=1 Tax=Solanum chilense TaxID=4083 RepID=A0A6N2BXV1_SOLCI|nr:hypothetical protein EJD97_001228 [Solanum chilense]